MEGAMTREKRILFICGSLSQTIQMQEIAKQLPHHDCRFTPYYGDEYESWLVQAAVADGTIDGQKARTLCLKYLNDQKLPVDMSGELEDYRLIVTSTDLTVQRSTPQVPVVLVQERFIVEHPSYFGLVNWQNVLRRWLSRTIRFNSDGRYDRLCVASEWYKEEYIRNGADPARIIVTGIPGVEGNGFEAHPSKNKPAQNIARVCRDLVQTQPMTESASEYALLPKSLLYYL